MKNIDMLGRDIEITKDGMIWKGDARHQEKLLKHFGLDEDIKALARNGYEEDGPQGEEHGEDGLTPQEESPSACSRPV